MQSEIQNSKTVKCPYCKAILTVKNSKNVEIKIISCPKCGESLKVSFRKRKEPVEAPTYIPQRPKEVNNRETQAGNTGSPYATKIRFRQKEKNNPRLLCNGQFYELESGENIIGRQTDDSLATIQINTNDLYMSRQHIKIIVNSQKDGVKNFVLGNYKNMNKTMVNGQVVEKEDLIRLSDGDVITIGHTEIQFKLKP